MGRTYSLKIGEGFFTSQCISSLRTMSEGSELVLVCIKVLLAAARGGGVLRCIGLEPTLADEVALDIGEAASSVRVVLNHLVESGKATRISDMELTIDTDCRRWD